MAIFWLVSAPAALNPRRWTILPRLGPPSRTPIPRAGIAHLLTTRSFAQCHHHTVLRPQKIFVAFVFGRPLTPGPRGPCNSGPVGHLLRASRIQSLTARFHAPFPLLPAHPA